MLFMSIQEETAFSLMWIGHMTGFSDVGHGTECHSLLWCKASAGTLGLTSRLSEMQRKEWQAKQTAGKWLAVQKANEAQASTGCSSQVSDSKRVMFWVGGELRAGMHGLSIPRLSLSPFLFCVCVWGAQDTIGRCHHSLSIV